MSSCEVLALTLVEILKPNPPLHVVLYRRFAASLCRPGKSRDKGDGKGKDFAPHRLVLLSKPQHSKCLQFLGLVAAHVCARFQMRLFNMC